MAELHFPELNAADSRVAQLMFEFVQFLLDDDANLTPAGNLTGTARQKLRARLQELMAAESPETEGSGAPEPIAERAEP
jgi:hypothetical protein